MSMDNSFPIYWQAGHGNPIFDSKEALQEEVEGNSLNFYYGDVEYDDFVKCYKSEGKAYRKIGAVPYAITGLVKAICHLSKAIFIGLLSAYRGNESFKINMYRAARDLEESFGWIIGILHDKLGSFFVQKSLFHQECYSIFENKKAVIARECLKS